MNKIIALIISVGSIFFGLFVLINYGTRLGGEGALTILAMWGMPLTLLVESFLFIFKSDLLNPWGYYFFYFLQYQLIALIFLKWTNKKNRK